MSLTFIGLGLFDEKDLSLKGLDAAQQCDDVLMETYTSYLAGSDIRKIEACLGKPVTVLSRDDVEQGDSILDRAAERDVALLVGGDPMMATTHVDLRLRAAERAIQTRIIHGASITSAACGLLGLQNYKFGRSTTVVFPEKKYFPHSPYDVIKNNRPLHTLALLDIRADEQRIMTANEGIETLLKIEDLRGEGVFTKETLVCVVARAGSDVPVVRADYADVLLTESFGDPLHCLIVPGDLHFMEAEALVAFAGAPRAILETTA